MNFKVKDKKLAYKLREHQLDIIEQAEAAITFGSKKIIMDLPPAYGKSLIISEMANKYKQDGVMIVISITALLDQIAHHLEEQGVEYSILKAGYDKHFNSSCKVQLVMAQTLHARRDKIKFKHKFKIWQQDEGHMSHPDVSKRTRECLEKIDPECIVLYSGTPFTAEGYAFTGYEYLSNLKTKELLDKGWLCPIKYFIPKWAEDIDLSSIKTTTNDYNTVELDKIINTTQHLTLALESMNQMDAKNKKTLVFASSIEQADHFEEILRKDGYLAKAYHSKTEKNIQPLIMDSFINNRDFLHPREKNENLFETQEEPIGEKIKCLISISKISVGFDCPDINLGVQLRPTKSYPLYLQQIMRLARNFRPLDSALEDISDKLSYV